MRICGVNINGISKDLQWLDWELLLRDMYNLQIDILGVVEPNINFNNHSVMLQLKDIAKKQDRGLQLSTSCSNQLNSSIKKMGGTMTIMGGRWAGRKQLMSSDKKGRWSQITLAGTRGKHVTIITAYRVCKQKGGVGTMIYHQQQLDFEEDNSRNVQLRKQFCTDMVALVRQLHSDNHTVVLLGDFNDDLNLESGQVTNMLLDCGLKNTIHVTRGDDTILPPTYSRGRKCLDMIAITDDATTPSSLVKRAGFFPYYHYFHTDHRAIFCDLDTKLLFGHFKPDLTPQTYRPFTTNNIKKCNKFKSELRDLYTKANIFQRVTNLNKNFNTANQDNIGSIIEKCIKLGKTTSELLICAGRRVSKKPYKQGKPFSDKLSTAAKDFKKKKTLLRYLLNKHSSERNGDMEAQVRLQIRNAYSDLREIQRNAEQERKKFLQQLANKRAGEWNLSQNAALNVILQSEASKKTYARHGSVMTKQKTGSIENLTIPVPKYSTTVKDTEKAGWDTIDDEETVFSLLLRKNAQQLMRSSKSPFAKGPIVDGCGIDGNGRYTKKLLNGIITDYEV
jgi:exonuclease III